MGKRLLTDSDYEKMATSGIISLHQFIDQTFNIKDNEVIDNELNVGKDIYTLFDDIDQNIGTIQSGKLYCVAVKPGKGKTAFLLSLAKNIAINQQIPIGIFSPERSSSKLIQRIIESETASSFSRVVSDYSENTTSDSVNKFISLMESSSFFIDDSSILSPEEMEEKIQFMINELNVKVIFIDNVELFAQHIINIEKNMEEHEKLMSKLKELAEKYNTPIIAFSQVSNSKFLNEPDSIPSIENIPHYITGFCDTILILHRPNIINYYKPGCAEWKGHAKVFIVRHFNPVENSGIRIKYIEKTDSFANNDHE